MTSRRGATEAHFARVRAGRVESVETSALHLDILRDLKRINAHIAAAAYAVLEKRGELLSSRLRQERSTPPLAVITVMPVRPAGVAFR